MTPAGIEPAPFRFVAQHINHCATAVLTFGITSLNNHISFRFPAENAVVLAIARRRAESRYRTVGEERTH